MPPNVTGAQAAVPLVKGTAPPAKNVVPPAKTVAPQLVAPSRPPSAYGSTTEARPTAKPMRAPESVRSKPAKPSDEHSAPAIGKPTAPGDVAWRYPTLVPGQETSPALRNCPAVDSQGRIFAAIGREVVALEEQQESIRVLWKYPASGHIPGSPALGADGRIRVHAGDGMLHCVTERGEPAWPPVAVGEPLGWASPLVDAESNTWICAYGGGLIKVDPRGARKNATSFRSRQKLDSTGLIHGHTLYVGAENGFVYAIDLAGSSGKCVWDQAADRGKTEWFINSAPAMSPRGELIVAGRDEYVYGFALDGTQLWRLHIRGQMLASPVIDAAGNIYVGVGLLERGEPGQGKLVGVHGQSHCIRWEYEAAGPVESTPVLADDGTIYFGDNSGAIHAVDAEGKRRWTRSVGSAVRSAGTIPAANRVIFGLDDGTLVALLTSSRRLATGGWPKYMGDLAQRADAGGTPGAK